MLWPKMYTMAALEVSQMLHNMTKMFYLVHKRLRNTIQPSMDFYNIVHTCVEKLIVYKTCFITFYVWV